MLTSVLPFLAAIGGSVILAGWHARRAVRPPATRTVRRRAYRPYW